MNRRCMDKFFTSAETYTHNMSYWLRTRAFEQPTSIAFSNLRPEIRSYSSLISAKSISQRVTMMRMMILWRSESELMNALCKRLARNAIGCVKHSTGTDVSDKQRHKGVGKGGKIEIEEQYNKINDLLKDRFVCVGIKICLVMWITSLRSRFLLFVVCVRSMLFYCSWNKRPPCSASRSVDIIFKHTGDFVYCFFFACIRMLLLRRILPLHVARCTINYS